MKILLAFVTSFVLMAIFLRLAHADPPPGPLDPKIHAWFERQHNLHGGLCCSIADGHALEADDWGVTDGEVEVDDENGLKVHMRTFWVLIAGRHVLIQPWQMRVPDSLGEPNPLGRAIVWWSWGREEGAGLRIFCFTPGFMP